MMKRIIQATIATALLIGASAQADLIFTPEDSIYSGLDCGLCGPGTSKILDWLDANVADFDSEDETYKSDENGSPIGTDSGPFADDYWTTYSNPVGDPGNALISWHGGDVLTDVSSLLVKGGNNSPIWYLFDISAWDGMMGIELTNFWPDSGAISHVAIYGGVRAVPEPGTLGMLGLGLLGLALAKRRRRV